MWRTVAAAVLAVALAGDVHAAAPTSDAACVTNSEANQAFKLNRTMGKVHEVTGTTGRRLSSYMQIKRVWQDRIYDRCGTPEATGKAGSYVATFSKRGAWRLEGVAYRYGSIVADN